MSNDTKAMQRAVRRHAAKRDRELKRRIERACVQRHFREPGPMRRFARWLVDILREIGERT